MRRYQFVVGMTISALEDELNRIMNDDPSTKLIQVLYAQGTGFIGIIEHIKGVEVLQSKQIVQPVKSRENPRGSKKGVTKI